jgi:hypothetical protein
LHRFFDRLKKSTSQPTRYEPFTDHLKIGRLYDSGAFSSGTISDDFPRNLFKINWMALKSARPQGRQKRVTYNNMLGEKRLWVIGFVVGV